MGTEYAFIESRVADIDPLLSLGSRVIHSGALATFANKLENVGQSRTAIGGIRLYHYSVATGNLGAHAIISLAQPAARDIAAPFDSRGFAGLNGAGYLRLRPGQLKLRGLTSLTPLGCSA